MLRMLSMQHVHRTIDCSARQHARRLRMHPRNRCAVRLRDSAFLCPQAVNIR